MTPMYLDHFGMTGAPFSIAPDPRYLFMSAGHREALAHLLYGVKCDDGFVVVTGEVGTGKTTVCRCLLEQLPAGCELALIFNPKLSALELLATICEEFRIAVPETHPGIKAYVDHINAWLLAVHAKGRMAVLIIDEAQSLAAEVLEQIRLLTNLETNQRKLLRIVLLGQPQLRDLLARPDMVQLTQRIVARYHLKPLSRQDMEGYVAHRLAAAGAPREIFNPAALERLYRLSRGTPRLVNIIADRALLGAYIERKERIDGAMVLQASQEVLGTQPAARRRIPTAILGLGGLCGMLAVAAFLGHYDALFPASATPTPARHAVTAPIVPASQTAGSEANVLVVLKPSVDILAQGRQSPVPELVRPLADAGQKER